MRFFRADLAGREALPGGKQLAVRQDDALSVAAVWDTIAARAESLLPRSNGPALKRHQQEQCRAAAVALSLAPSSDLLLIAEHLRVARGSLSDLLGVSATEAMLDALFGRFCLGK